MPIQIRVIDAAAAMAWQALSETAAVLVASRLRDPRGTNARNLLYVVGGALSPIIAASFATAGVELAQSITSLSLDQFLDGTACTVAATGGRPAHSGL